MVTKTKYVSDKTPLSIPDTEFKACLRFNDKRYLVAEILHTVRCSVQTAKHSVRDKPTSMELRLIGMIEIGTKKHIGIYTCNRTKPATDIAFYMRSQRGESENFFHEMKARFNLDYHPGYDIKELEKQPLIDNPKMKEVKKAIRILKKGVEELEKEILVIEASLIKHFDNSEDKKQNKSQTELTEKLHYLAQFEEKFTTMPDIVRIIEVLKGRTMNCCDLEKKKLYDF